MSTEILNYEELLESYDEGLFNQLRGFRPSTEFLETWVPDSDPIKSILALVESVHLFGQNEVKIFLGPKILENIELTSLSNTIQHLGLVNFSDMNEGKCVSVSLNSSSQSNPRKEKSVDYRSEYRLQLGKLVASESIQHEGTLSEKEGCILLEAKAKDARLSVLVDSKTTDVVRAAHSGVISPEGKVLYDYLCDVMVGLPMLEVSEHAVLKVEYRLRQYISKSVVKGIVTPKNADPIFQQPLELVRSLYSKFQEVTGKKPKNNFFDLQPLESWATLSSEERVSQLQKKTDEFTQARFKEGAKIEIIQMLDAIRAIVAFREGFTLSERGAALLGLEKFLKAECDRRLELFMEEVKDQNSKRRL